MYRNSLLTRHRSCYSLMICCLALAIPGIAYGQCQLTDDYSDAARWTQVGSLVEVAAGSAVFKDYCPDGEQRRIHAPLGTTLFEESTFVADIDFQVLDIGDIPFPSVGHVIIALTAGTQEPLSACPDIPCTGNPPGNQDGIMVLYATPDTGEGDVHFKIVVKDGDQELTSETIANGVLDTWFYLRLERLSPEDVRLSVFSDAGRTKHIAGSPVMMDIPGTVSGLTHVQHGNVARWNPERQLLGKVDNLCIEYSMTSSARQGSAGHLPSIFPNPATSVVRLADSRTADITLFNLQGVLLGQWHHVSNIDISHLFPGLYLLEIRTGDLVRTHRLLKQ